MQYECLPRVYSTKIVASTVQSTHGISYVFLSWIGATGERNFLPRFLEPDRQIEAREEEVNSERSGAVAEEK